MLHSLPTGFSLGDMRNVRDPKGMMSDELGADMHVISGDATAVRNLMLAVERCHLAVEGVVATPYAAGLAALVDDEVELGTTVIDMGGGTTSVGVFFGGRLVHVDALALGGNHVTMDIARGLNTRLADAERLKTLYGACIASVSDERETISVTLAGDDGDHPTHVPKSQLVRIIRPRVEEILELVRDRLKKAGFPRNLRVSFHSDGRGESDDRYDRGCKAHPLGTDSCRQAVGNSGTSGSWQKVRASLRRSVCWSIRRRRRSNISVRAGAGRKSADGTNGYFARVGQWLRESF